MHKKFLLASHGLLAKGLQSSLDILTGKGQEVMTINAYVTEEDYTPQITVFIDSVGEGEQGIIFTDLYGGSVNQKVVAEILAAKKENLFVIANANLGVVLSLLLSAEEVWTEAYLQEVMQTAALTLVPLTLPSENAAEELDSFF